MATHSLEQFKSAPDARFSKGTWVVEYHDDTHLFEGHLYLSWKIRN